MRSADLRVAHRMSGGVVPAPAPSAGATAGASSPGGRVPVARRRSWPDRSRPTRISPNSRSIRAGSPRARSVSTADSVTALAASVAENGRWSKRSGGANRPRPGTMSGSPAPPGTAGNPTFPRVRGPGGTAAPGGKSSITPAPASSGSDRRATATRYPADAPPMATAASASIPPSTSWTTRPSRAIDGSTAASDRPIATACHDHGARRDVSASASIGSIAAASRPRVQAVPW